MTKLEIYRYAWLQAIDIWHFWVKEDEKNPSELTEVNRERSWEKVKQIQEIYEKEIENNDR